LAATKAALRAEKTAETWVFERVGTSVAQKAMLTVE
jgi:hypothetical protein